MCVCARALCCVVSADVTGGTALSRGVSKSWDREREGEKGKANERERGREKGGTGQL